MFNQGNGYSLADIAAATGRDNDNFGSGNGAWQKSAMGKSRN